MAIPAQRLHEERRRALESARPRRVTYPDSDGKPMAETEKHRELMFYSISALQAYFADQPLVYVSGNNFLYYEEGNPKKVVSPDVYIVFGVEKRLRDLYKTWEEGTLPSVVIEFTSKTTQRDDVDKKLPLYEQVLRVPEYFQFDPTGDYLTPRLQGYRLNENGVYDLLLPVENRLHSEQLRLDLVQEGETLRLVNPATGEALRTFQEAEAGRRAAEARAETAEAELARARAEIEALRRSDSGAE